MKSKRVAKLTKEEILRHRVLSKIHDSFGGCFLDNTGQFLRACRMDSEGMVTQVAKMRSCRVDQSGSQRVMYAQWFKLTAKGKKEFLRLDKLVNGEGS